MGLTTGDPMGPDGPNAWTFISPFGAMSSDRHIPRMVPVPCGARLAGWQLGASISWAPLGWADDPMTDLMHLEAERVSREYTSPLKSCSGAPRLKLEPSAG